MSNKVVRHEHAWQRAEERQVTKPKSLMEQSHPVEFWSPRIFNMKMTDHDTMFILSTYHTHKHLKNRLTPIFPGIKITKNLWLTNMYDVKLAEPAQWGTFIEKVNKALR